MLLTPLPLSQTVTPSRTPSPLEPDVLYGRPLGTGTTRVQTDYSGGVTRIGGAHSHIRATFQTIIRVSVFEQNRQKYYCSYYHTPPITHINSLRA